MTARKTDDDERRPGTRDRILIAAAEMLGEDPTARLSVRAVAARAGVSTGSLRHFFPTQQALVETVVASVYDVEVPDDPILDTDRSPEERLIACLRQLLGEVGTGERAREHWRRLHEAYVVTTPTEDQVASYLAIERLGVHRIRRWLQALADEGPVRTDLDEGARFLATVLDGLFTQRAMPTEPARFGDEAAALRIAVSAVLAGDDHDHRGGP
ncbi:TetR/AcrR family transcriptional regulator [Clavibacter lycopersici]|uniref:TetR/AcrR family transcriptional regulator n=1 Tax=Clavibacter lycopersici TaxID=2301718 RepID=A0A399T5Q1_9MICO|nr:TetR/AcrR family transcriptional regulator [Clavibacter lycopersici]RIJ51690.1 TetR/AcrR family transcriptional regulator [Clavibacter lycopersici]RIJ61134.1 TetR/AcrR family transcriptional regulator [Clavibacter lycopersici]